MEINNKRGYIMFKLKLYFLFFGLCWVQMSSFAVNQLIIKYKPNVDQIKMVKSGQLDIKELNKQLMQPLSDSQINKLSQIAGMKIKDFHAIGNGAHVLILEKNVTQEDLKKIINKIEADRAVQYAVEDQVGMPNTSIHPRQWNMLDVFTPPGEPNVKWYGDNFVEAWKLMPIKPGEGVIVAVVDTGYTPHKNFFPNLIPLSPSSESYGYQFISDCRRSGDCDAHTPDDQVKKAIREDALDQGDFITESDINNPNNSFLKEYCKDRGLKPRNSTWHGSIMTGIIANNGYKEGQWLFAGGAWGAKVLPVRVGGKCGVQMSDVFDGALWAAGLHSTINNSNPAQVINISIGARGLCNKFYQDIINQINTNSKAIIVVSAGNDTINISNQYPANCEGVISVSAKTAENRLKPDSNSGATTITASGGSKLPPCDKIYCGIFSSRWGSLQKFIRDDKEEAVMTAGTSAAAANVSAAVANIISVLKYYGKKEYDLKLIIHILREKADRLERPYHCNVGGCVSGHTLNMGEAIKSILPDRLIGYAFLGSATYIINKPHNELVRCDVKQKDNQTRIDTSKEACVFYQLNGGGYAVSIFALRLSKSNNYLLVGTSLGIYVCHIKNFVCKLVDTPGQGAVTSISKPLIDGKDQIYYVSTYLGDRQYLKYVFRENDNGTYNFTRKPNKTIPAWNISFIDYIPNLDKQIQIIIAGYKTPHMWQDVATWDGEELTDRVTYLAPTKILWNYNPNNDEAEIYAIMDKGNSRLMKLEGQFRNQPLHPVAWLKAGEGITYRDIKANQFGEGFYVANKDSLEFFNPSKTDKELKPDTSERVNVPSDYNMQFITTMEFLKF